MDALRESDPLWSGHHKCIRLPYSNELVAIVSQTNGVANILMTYITTWCTLRSCADNNGEQKTGMACCGIAQGIGLHPIESVWDKIIQDMALHPPLSQLQKCKGVWDCVQHNPNGGKGEAMRLCVTQSQTAQGMDPGPSGTRDRAITPSRQHGVWAASYTVPMMKKKGGGALS